MISLCGGQKVEFGKVKVELPKTADFAQFRIAGDGSLTPIANP